MTKRNHKNPPEGEHIIFNELSDLDNGNAVSVTDCTGLIPSAPHTREELEAYDDILNYSPDRADIYNSDSKSDA